MPNPHRPEKSKTDDLPPGADRFWGQFSQARAGRSEDEGPDRGEAGREERGTGQECLEWCPICRSAELLRATASPEMRRQLQTIQNEAFQIFRAFAVAYAERGSGDPFAGPGDGQGPAPEGKKPGGRRSDDTGGDGPGEPRVSDISIE